LVAPGATRAPADEVRVQPRVDADGLAASCSLQGTDENELVLPKGKPLSPPTREEIVIRNCLQVRDAAEAWAAESGGKYPGDPATRNALGHTLIDFLPGGTYLVNPFDGARDQPLYIAPGFPGETDYLSFDDNRCGHCGPPCDPNGYMITGFGESGEILLVTQNWPDSLVALDALTIANCLLVQRAVERFAAENGGAYPRGSWDLTPLGHTYVDFLPCGTLLRNPYHCQNTEPVDESAAQPGETGYVPMMQDGRWAGYWITGHGRRELIVEIGREPGVDTAKTTCKIHPRDP
jgi:hypothetical protein